MKRFLVKLIRSIAIVAVCSVLFSAAMLVPYREDETANPQIVYSADADYFMHGIYLNGAIIYNWTLAEPVVVANGTAYIPLDITALADESEVSAKAAEAAVPAPDEESVGIAISNCLRVRTTDDREDQAEPEEVIPEEKRFSAVVPALESVRVAHVFEGTTGTYGYSALKGWSLDDATDIFLSDSGVYYGSLNFFKENLGIDACYREGRGLYLSTDPAVSAEEWADRDTNPSYIEGMTKYIMSVNKALSEKEAVDIEFLIRHVAGQYKYMTPELVSGIIMVESRFRPYIENSVGATGLMQVLIKYAKVRGYTVSMLKDPHINLEYGVEFMNRLITGYSGDVTAGLAAYNMGAAYVRSGGDYNKAYPNAVYGKMSDMKNWLVRNGYSAEFKEQL